MESFSPAAFVLFWVATILLFQTYVGIHLYLLCITRSKSDPPEVSPPDELPSMTVVIPAYNEEAIIMQKIENLLEQDYPGKLLRICVVSDASTDRTNEIVTGYNDRSVELIVMPERNGKFGIIDAIIPQLKSDVVVITDANVVLKSDALLRMGELYADPSIGSVCGNMTHVVPRRGKNVDSEISYHNWEIVLKSLMSRIGSVISVYGGFYSFRQHLFKPLGKRAVHDDVILPLEVIASNFKVVYAKNALGYEEILDSIGEEFRRRMRMGAVNLSSLLRTIELSLRSGLQISFITISYKILRWLSPYLLLVMFVTSHLLATVSPPYFFVAAVFDIGLLLAVAGGLLDKIGYRAGIATAVYHFTIMNIAVMAGLFGWIKGVKKYWNPRG